MTDDDADVPADSHQRMRVSAQALRGLAHPLRARLLDELKLNGPATATILGQRLGESSGATSYHLRQLSRYGFIENEPERTGGRERWWRIRPDGWHMPGHEFLSNPETRLVAQTVLDRLYQQQRKRFADWTALVRDSPDMPMVRRWKNAASDSTSHARMTPEETAEFAEALHGFLRSWGRRFQGRTPESHPDTDTVQVDTAVFPILPEAEGRSDGTAIGEDRP